MAIRRALQLVVATCFFASTACTGAEDVDAVAGFDQPSNTEITAQPGTTPPPTLQLGSSDDLPPESPEATLYSIDDVLLADDAAFPPWEPQRRTTDITPSARSAINDFPTNCEPLAVLEHTMPRARGESLWWQEGANLTHRVIWLTEDEATAVMKAARQLPFECSVVVWDEAGSTSISEFGWEPEPTDGVETVVVDMRSGIGDVDWMAVSRRGATLSVVTYSQWATTAGPPIPDESMFTTAVDAAIDQLATAAPVAAPTSDPGDPTAGEPTQPETTEPEPTQPDPTGAQLARFETLLVDDGDLPGLTVAFEELPDAPVAPTASELDACPALAGGHNLEGWFSLIRYYSSPDGDIAVYIGEAPTPEAAGQAVNAMAELDQCAPTIVLGDAGSAITFSSFVPEIPDADTAAGVNYLAEGAPDRTIIFGSADEIVFAVVSIDGVDEFASGEAAASIIVANVKAAG